MIPFLYQYAPRFPIFLTKASMTSGYALLVLGCTLMLLNALRLFLPMLLAYGLEVFLQALFQIPLQQNAVLVAPALCGLGRFGLLSCHLCNSHRLAKALAPACVFRRCAFLY